MPGGEFRRFETPQSSGLSKLTRSFWDKVSRLKPGSDTEELAYLSGYNEALGEALYLAKEEEQRVVDFLRTHDGYCLDSEEDRTNLINALYGRGETDDQDPLGIEPLENSTT